MVRTLLTAFIFCSLVTSPVLSQSEIETPAPREGLADIDIEIPEFHGMYAFDQGRSIDLNWPALRVDLYFSEAVEFLWYIENTTGTPTPMSWQVGEVLCRTKPVKGHKDMIRIVPRTPLETGVNELTGISGSFKVRFTFEVDPSPESLHFSSLRSSARLTVNRLKELSEFERAFKKNDLDGNGVNDFWTEDLAGLYGAENASGELMKLVNIHLANTDGVHTTQYAAPVLASADATSLDDYQFAAVPTDAAGKPFNEQREDHFAFSAYPLKYRTGTQLTFIVNEKGDVYGKDIGGGPCTQWPNGHLLDDGWMHYSNSPQSGPDVEVDRVNQSKKRVFALAKKINLQLMRNNVLPQSVNDLLHPDPELFRKRRHEYLEWLPFDAWGNPLLYEAADRHFQVISLGRDGQPGGDGLDADIRYPEPQRVR